MPTLPVFVFEMLLPLVVHCATTLWGAANRSSRAKPLAALIQVLFVFCEFVFICIPLSQQSLGMGWVDSPAWSSSTKSLLHGPIPVLKLNLVRTNWRACGKTEARRS